MPQSQVFEALISGFQLEPWDKCWELSEAGGSHVYVLVAQSPQQRFPFYVGQTKRFRGRMGDYSSAYYSASTDFKVGVTIKRLKKMGFDIYVYFKAEVANSPLSTEKRLIRAVLCTGFHLLNELSGYLYTDKDSKDSEEEAIHCFVLMMLREASRPDL